MAFALFTCYLFEARGLAKVFDAAMIFLRRLSQRMGAIVLTLVCLTMSAHGQAQSLSVPPPLQLSIMIKTTLIAYNQANQTGNYSVLRDLGSPSFQKANTPARLAEIFQAERYRNVDLSPVVILAPKLVQPAAIDAQGRLVLVGIFDSKPEQVSFTLGYEVVDGFWKLFAIGVKTGVAQAEAEPPAKSKATEKPKTAEKGKTETKKQPAKKKPVKK